MEASTRGCSSAANQAENHPHDRWTTVELLAAWSILLETYLGTPDVSFIFEETAIRRQLIRLNLSDGIRVGHTTKEIQCLLNRPEETALENEIDSSPLKIVFVITQNRTLADSEILSVHNGEGNTKDHPHLLMQCDTLHQSSEIAITAFADANTFGPGQGSRLKQQFMHILNQICLPNAEERLVSEIERASRDDIHTIWDWNGNMATPAHENVLSAISKFVELQPDAVAVHAWDGEMTYRELDELSNKLAAQLLRSGVSRGMILPMLFEKTMWTPVAILGVLKSGGAFSLLEEDLPQERFRQLVQLISPECTIILSSSMQLSKARKLAVEVMVVDSSLRDKATLLPPVAHRPLPSDTCYVIFTSGTTGTPKGAIIQHRNVCAFAEFLAPKCCVTSGSRILALASYAFDVSVGNIFFSLLNGACLCTPSSWECKNDISRAIIKYRITYAEMTPSISKTLAPLELSSLKVLNLLGEACTEPVIAGWREANTRVMNTYGPAECTVTTVVNENVLKSIRPSVIGTGLGATWIVDLHDPNRLCPIGGIGELVIEGPQVGAGYLHNPGLTERSFLQNPQWLVAGCAPVNKGRSGRVYRTGDIVRYVDGNQLEYLGRRDLQVKIRGQRIELGEVAAHLHKHLPKTAEWSTCVVTLQNGVELLVVFMVASSTAAQALSKMLTAVNKELFKAVPAAMVPSAWIPIDKIPLSITGKTDYRKLKQIAASLTPDGLIFGANDTISDTQNQDAPDIELKLRALWAQVLNRPLESIGSNSNFFANGGESLAAIKLVSVAAREGVNLAVSTVFTYPRLADMAKNSRIVTFISEPPLKPFESLKGSSTIDSVVKDLAAKYSTAVENIEDAYPATLVQQGLMAAGFQNLQAYIGRTILTLPANTNQSMLLRAWEIVAQTHPILRTRITEMPTLGYFQVVLKYSDLSWSTNGGLKEHKLKDMKEPMGLGTPLCRWAIVTESGSTYMLLTMHHALYDGWMLPRLGMEVFKAYRGVRLDPYMGFNSFVKYINGIPLDSAREFWSNYLAEPSMSATFPHIPQSVKDPRPDAILSKRFVLPDNAIVGASLATTIRAAWALLSAKLLGNNDVTFGATLSGRNVPLAGIEDMLGPAISTVPVRVRLDMTEEVECFVQRVQEEAVAAIPHENIGLQKIRMFNEDTREGSKFQTLLIVHPPPFSGTSHLAPASIDQEDSQLRSILERLDLSKDLTNFSEYGLMILVSQQHQGGLLIETTYDSRIMAASQVELLLEQFAHVIKEIRGVENRTRRLEDLDYASPYDIETVRSWNKSPIESIGQCIHEVISEKAARHPQSEAICAWDGSFTYKELDHFASVLAHHLTSNGVERGCVVPICMDKSRWTAAAMVGILRSGAAFVLLDTVNLPKQRLQAIVDQTAATCILTNSAKRDFAQNLLPTGSIITADDLLQNPRPITLTCPASVPEDTAFLVYTSGSTGKPKGITITHANFMTAVYRHERPLNMRSETRVYDYASYSFDIAVHNALTILALGGCLCIPSEHDRHNNIEGSFRRLGANWVNLTPSVARLLNPLALPDLKTLVLSGEPVGRNIVHQWSTHVQLINAYGPAECQICTVHNYGLDDENASSIGRGVGCRTWIVDKHAKSLAPVGAVGELVIEGPIVSPGYFKMTQKSESPWLRNPSWLSMGSSESKNRKIPVYRTGDLVRYHSDGSIIFVGRAATQVKINGQRVELEEVEFYLRQELPTIEDVVADLSEINGNKRLCAFILSSRPSSSLQFATENAPLTGQLVPPPPKLKSRLLHFLPRHMVPAVFCEVSVIPLTPTSKIDRAALKALTATFTHTDILATFNQTIQSSALDSTQKALQQAWSIVLGYDLATIGPGKDFFQLGGDSISAMRLVNACRKLGLTVTVSDVLRHPQFEELAMILSKPEAEKIAVRGRAEIVPPFDLLPPGEDRIQAVMSAALSCNVQPDDIEDIYPCSPLQEGLLALTAVEYSAYMQHTEIKIPGHVSLKAMVEAFEYVFSSTRILRTRIVQTEGAALHQVVLRENLDWRRYATRDEYLSEASKIPVILGRPLVRFGIVQGTSESHDLSIIWTIHHALFDHHTIQLILSDVANAYDGVRLSIRPEYNLFIRFIHSCKTRDMEWWRSTLQGATEAPLFPKAVKPTSKTITKSTAKRRCTLPMQMPGRWTLATLLKAAWAILVSRLTRNESILFGEIRSGRAVDIEGSDLFRGPTMATVPIYLQLDHKKNLREFFDVVQENSIAMQPYEHLGLPNIAGASNDARAGTQFQTLFVLQESQKSRYTGPVSNQHLFDIEELDDIRNFNSYGLMLIFKKESKDLSVQAVFRDSVLSADFVNYILKQTLSLFQAICRLPLETTLYELDNATKDDLDQLWTWNRLVPQSADKFMHDLIAEQAQMTPNELAIHAHDGKLTYMELDEYASRISQQLIVLGVGPGCYVPLCFEKSLWAAVSMLAVLKSGAAFSLLDISHPFSRLSYICDTLNAPLVLVSTAQREIAAKLCNQVFVVGYSSLGGETSPKTRPSQAMFDQPKPAESIMYVAFTSGSTGTPKGVQVTHRNLSSAAVAQARQLGFGSGCRVFDFSSHSFDATIWHHFWALTTGSCLCIPSQSDRMNNLAGAMNAFKSTTAFLTPSLARTIDPTEVPTMRTLFLGGEAVTPVDVSIWGEHVRLVGAYGPTEVTPVSLFQDLKSSEMASVIGRGIGVRPWIVDPENYNQLKAIGAVGELLLEGPLVSLGYYADPEKTQASFISNPEFLGVRGQHGRVFKTGDLARCLHDGSIEYLGRADMQIKLRGQRIDLGEVEYCVKQVIPDLRSVIGEIIQMDAGVQRLVIFYRSLYPELEQAFDASAVKTFMSQRLPKYMIPENFIPINTIPLTSSGKIDRRELRAIGHKLLQLLPVNMELGAWPVYGPLTEIEARLLTLWATSLGRDEQLIPPSPGLDFFQLGGDSIAAMKLSTLAGKARLGLTVNLITRESGLAAMALNSRRAATHTARIVRKPFSLLEPSVVSHVLSEAAMLCHISEQDIQDIYPCTPLQEELFALTMKQPGAYMRRSVFDIPSDIDCERLIRAWHSVIEQHEILRTRFVVISGFNLLQVVTRTFDWEYSDTLADYLSISDRQADIGTSLARWAIVYEKVPKLVWTIHHALYDGWSSQIVENHLRLAYYGQSLPKSAGFSHFVEYVNSQDTKEAKSFWQKRLQGADSSAVFPKLPSESYQGSPTGCVKRTIGMAEVPHIQTIIHASWSLIISKITGCSDVIFGATLAGRDAPLEGLEDIVGPTIAPVPIRITIPSEQTSIKDFIDNIKSESASMVPFQHFGAKSIGLINENCLVATKYRTLLVVTPESLEPVQGIKVSSYDALVSGTNAFHTFPLVLFFVPSRGQIDIEVIYDPHVIEHHEVTRLVGRLESVLPKIADNTTDKLVSDIDVTGKDDLEEIWAWNSVVPERVPSCLHDLIIERAHAHPDSIAVDAWDTQISYGQLDQLSYKVAGYLCSHGVGRGDIVPIVFPKSAYVAVAALAVLRTGAAFIPLDPSQPLSRIQAIIHQINSRYSLAAKSTAQIAKNISDNVIVLGDEIKHLETTANEHSLNSEVSLPNHIATCPASAPEDTAFILSTSGSTGVPKGSTQTHQAWASAIRHQTTLSRFHKDTRAFEFASYAFDVSWNTLFKVLCAGGCLCVPSEDERQNDLVGAINRSKANHVELTPSVARLLDPRELPTLKTLILSGEPVDLREFQHWRPDVHIIVAYGPSECTSASCLDPGFEKTTMCRGIGKGVGAVTWLVDPQNYRNLVPIGAVGELLIEGPLVGSGYYKNGSQTQASYVNNVPWLAAGFGRWIGRSSVLYKTGDLARYDASGNLQFVDRKDLQVKLRGQRIELEEVRHHILEAMRGHVSSVAACLVASPVENANDMLVAFLSSANHPLTEPADLLVPDPDTSLRLHEAHRLLQLKLPKYMVPAAFVIISNIPKTQNGKLDVRRLQSLASSASPEHIYRGNAKPKHVHLEPSSPVAIQLQRLWASVLNISPGSIGLSDDFFNLNGDSITAMRLVACARREGLDIRVSDIFESSSLSTLARIIELRAPSFSETYTIPAFSLLPGQIDIGNICLEAALKCGLQDPAVVEDIYPCTPLQEGMLVATAAEPGAFTSMRLYRLPPQIELNRMQSAWAEMVLQNPILRTRFVDLKNHGLCHIVTDEDAYYESYSGFQEFLENALANKLRLGSRMARWATINCSGEIYVVLTLHHAIYDGWTLSLFDQQLKECYDETKPTTVLNDMRLFVKYIGTLDENASTDFWSRELRGAETSTCYPMLPSEAYTPQPDMYHEVHLPMQSQSPPSGINLSALLQASWSILMARLNGSDNVTFGTILTGRHAPIDGIDTVVGPTITTVPIQVTVDPSQSLLHFMAEFRRKTAAMIPHEHLGLAKIRRINDAAAIACRFQTIVVIQPPVSSLGVVTSLLQEVNEREIPGFPDQTAILNQHCLMLEIIPQNGGLTVRCSFDSRVLNIHEIKRLIFQWGHIYQQLSLAKDDTSFRVRDVDATSLNDMRDIWRWNKTVPQPFDVPIHHTLSKIAKRQPEAYAIDAWDGKLTYQELDQFSSQLVPILRQHGVTPHCFVPLLFEKSKWTNVAMLALLKAGAAFVPLDAEHPEGMLRAIMQPLRPNTILCSALMKDQAARLAPHSLIIDESLGLVDHPVYSTDVWEEHDTKPSDIAYAVFTSGSTGKPKGVQISHVNLSSAIHHQAGLLGFTNDTRSLDSSSYAFDACIFNLFYTIAQGGCLCVPSDSIRKGDLSSFIAERKITLAQLTPSVSRVLDVRRTVTLKALILTGEPLAQSDIELWGNRLRLTNVYGPTECTIMSSASSPIEKPSQTNNIGCGLGTNLWLTEIGNPSRLAPIGTIGEILIEGPLVGLGYIGQKPGDSQAFVIDPPWLLAGIDGQFGRKGKLFRTGDQARYNEDGTLTYVGRIGSEIKLRGQRIDIAGLEDTIRRLIPRQYALTIAAEIAQIPRGINLASRQGLLVFVSPIKLHQWDNFHVEMQSLAVHLNSNLEGLVPSYLMPEALVLLESMPTTSSGKINHNRLRSMVDRISPSQLVWLINNPDKLSKRTPVSTSSEKILAKLWAQVLMIEASNICREDSFIRLGGDSLCVMRLTTTAHDQGFLLSTRDVFQTPQLAALAQLMVPLRDGISEKQMYEPFCLLSNSLEIPSITRHAELVLGMKAGDVTDILPANGFQVDYIHSSEEPLGLQYAHLDVSHRISWENLIIAMRTVIQAFECLRARFIEYQGKFYQAILREAPLVTEEITTTEQITNFSRTFCARDCRQARLSDCYTKLTLVNSGDSTCRIIIRLSHMQNDGWCQEQILNAIATAYNGVSLSNTPAFSTLLHNRAQDAEDSRAYWRNLLAGTTGVTLSPVVQPAKSNPIRTLRTVTLSNFQDANDNRTRPTIVINVAWALVLSELLGVSEVVFGNVTTGRNGKMPGLSDVVGPCVNMLPFRLKLLPQDKLNDGSENRLLHLLSQTAHQYDDRTAYEGLDWEDMVDTCTDWPKGTRYRSAVHYRNMSFYPTLGFQTGPDDTLEEITIRWNELVATPLWTTILAFPENESIRLWVLADPKEIGNDGADLILSKLVENICKILESLQQ